MPAKPQWFRRIRAAVETLRTLACDDIDRAGVETLLRVSRRDAIRLLHRFGGVQVGNSLKIDRSSLIHCLEAVAGGEDYQTERSRQRVTAQRLIQAEQDAKARSIQIPALPPGSPNTLQSLPVTIQLEPGRLSILYQSPEELLQQLLLLARTICHDHPSFLSRTSPG